MNLGLGFNFEIRKNKELFIGDIFKSLKKQKEDDLSNKEILYHGHFAKQHLSKGRDKIRYDNLSQVDYPIQRGIKTPANLLKGRVNISMDILIEKYFPKHIIKNFKELSQEFSKRTDVKAAIENGSLTIVTNHSTWLNVPSLILLLHDAFDVPFEQFYTYLGPAVTTDERAFSSINSISNLIKTFPPTKNGEVEGLEEEMNGVRAKSVRSVLEKTQKKGNIIFYCPSGTTDKFDEETEKINLVEPDQKAKKLIKSLNSNSKILSIGMNERDVFIKNNSKVRKGEEYMSIGELHNEREIKDPEEIINELVNLIVDKTGKTIGGRISA